MQNVLAVTVVVVIEDTHSLGSISSPTTTKGKVLGRLGELCRQGSGNWSSGEGRRKRE